MTQLISQDQQDGAKTEEVTLERMSYGRDAIGHLQCGKTVFVDEGVPQDVVKINIESEKASFARARIDSIITPSPLRVKSPCIYAGVCGGCSWQNLNYDAQLQAKRENVVSALVRTAHFDEACARALVAEVIGSPEPWGYRNKLELGVTRDAQGKLLLGMYGDASNELVPIASCKLVHKKIQNAPKALQGALRFLQGTQDLGVFRVGVRHSDKTGECEIALWTRPGAFPRATVAKTLNSALGCTSIVRVIAEEGKARKVKQVECLAGKGFWTESMAQARFAISAPSFFQVNTAQAEQLVRSAIQALGGVFDGDTPRGLAGMLIGDLYAGAGTFSVQLARAGADVIAVESAGSSVRDLRRNADMNRVDMEVIGGDAARELPELGGLDALIVDPPRAGLADGMVASIASAHPEKVVYVSCDTQTWARDVARFEEAGYRLCQVQPVDLFPQTYHVEVVSVFERM
ncbi:23S rRNA (uracil(1939)-C(5))-methyltransferase RlmD [Eggerthellaceae bacterium 3-80]|nr:23S rRNA (uracil(1939)-C(5))-methyltransferase RlmD [bacterium D16-34]